MPTADPAPDVSVILPCLNEATSIQRCVAEARRGLETASLCGEVLVVDNGSGDGSPELARRAGARVVLEPRPGYGSALVRGIEQARGQVAVMADADLTYDLSRLGELVARIGAGADLVLADRLDGASRATMPFLHRVVGTPVLSFLVRRAATRPVTVRDSQSGFRAFDLTSIRSLRLQSAGMEFASEMIIRAADAGLVIDEVKIPYRTREGESKLNTFEDGFRHLKLMFLLAPKLALLWPGVIALFLGTALGVATLLQPDGIGVGSFQWQPIFFGPIMLVLGSMLVANYATVAAVSPMSVGRGERDHRRLRRRLGAWGVAMMTAGVIGDGALLISHVIGADIGGRALALAGLAQGVVLAGAAVVMSAFLQWLFLRQQHYRDNLT